MQAHLQHRQGQSESSIETHGLEQFLNAEQGARMAFALAPDDAIRRCGPRRCRDLMHLVDLKV